jgi:hypothetical protein
MENIRGTGGNLSTVRSGHQAGITAARSEYIKTRNNLIKGGTDPVEASIQAQQAASDTYYSARNSYFEKRAERKRKNNVGVDRNPRADQNAIEGNNVPILLPEVAGVIPTLSQLNQQTQETEAAVQQINREQQQNAAPKPAAPADLLAQQDVARQNNERENARIKEEEKRRIEQQQQSNAEQAKKDREDWAQKQAAALDAKIAAKEKELADSQQRYDEAYGGWFGWVRNNVIGSPSNLAIEVSDKEKEIFRLKRAKNAALVYGDGQIDTNEFSGPEGVRTFVQNQSGLTEGRGAPGLTRYDRAGVRTNAENAEFMATEEQGIAATKAVVETGIQALGAVATLGASAVVGGATATAGRSAPTLLRTVTESALTGGVTEGSIAYAEGESAGRIAQRAAFSAGAGAVGAGLGYGVATGGSAVYRRFRPGQGPRIPMGGAPGGADDLVDPLRLNMDSDGAAAAIREFEDAFSGSTTTSALDNVQTTVMTNQPTTTTSVGSEQFTIPIGTGAPGKLGSCNN